MAENWQKVARDLNYNSEQEMWVDLYLTQKLGISKLQERLGYGIHTIQRRLAICGVQTRLRGGDNGNTPPAKNVLFHIDQRMVWGVSINELKRLINCSQAVVSGYKRNARGD